MATVGCEAVTSTSLEYMIPTKVEACKPDVLFKLKTRSGSMLADREAPDCRCNIVYTGAGPSGRRAVNP